MEQPLVSVFVASYNHEKYVWETLEGIRNQTYKNYELIIIDDSSTDDSVSAIEKWIKKYNYECQFITHKINKGLVKSINEALSLVKGVYFDCCASDDIWEPYKLEKHVRLLESLGGTYGVVFSDTYLIDENGQQLEGTFHSRYIPYFKPDTDYNYFEGMLKGNIIHGLAATYRTDVLKMVGGYDEKLFAEDWDMHIKLSLNTKIHFDKDYISARYRILPTSLNNSPSMRLPAIEGAFYSLIKYYGISKQGNSIILQSLNNYAQTLYARNYDGWRKTFFMLFKLNRTFSSFKYLIYALLKIDFSTLNKLKTCKNFLKGIFAKSKT